MERLEEERLALAAQEQVTRIAAKSDLLFADEAIRIVEFVDYRCGYCARGAADVATLSEVEQRAIRIVELPILGEASTDLAKVALGVRNTAGEDAYRAFHFAVFERAGRVGSRALALRLAEELGHDRAAIDRASLAPDVAEEINRNLALARSLGISGTPAFVSPTKLHEGLMELAELRQIINDEEKPNDQ
ncbi:DsbA family protein [Yoonia sp. SS1-5]|uniref:DsbA family protein n=1 Tax=Yoonia rhodophyticola TaxID=3137370 RepID=A0AAN0MD53_9RHOB